MHCKDWFLKIDSMFTDSNAVNNLFFEEFKAKGNGFWKSCTKSTESVWPTTGLEGRNKNIVFVNTFMTDYLNKHSRLEACIEVYTLDQYEEWYILEDGSLYHKEAKSSTPFYCIESVLVSKAFKVYQIFLYFLYSG